MNTQYHALEKSLLSDHTGLVAHNAEQTSLAERHPGLYKIALILATLIGYGFIYLFPLCLIGCAILIPNMILQASDKYDVMLTLLTIAATLFSGWMSWHLTRCKPALPGGRPLKVEEAPLLFDLLHDLRQQHKTAPIHDVRIIQEYQLTIIKTPRNGYPLNYRNTLLIGLPVLQSMSPKQLKYALQRQVIHLASMYRRSSGWAYFLSGIWDQYRVTYQNSWHPASLMMRLFFMIYAPLFRLLARPARIQQIHFADRQAAAFDSARGCADMLIVEAVHTKYLRDQFWPALMQHAYQHLAPPYFPYASIEQYLRNQLDQASAQQLLDTVLMENHERGDCPGLQLRLDQLGILNVEPPCCGEHSASRYLEESARALIIRQFDNLWLKASRHDWRKKYTQGQEEKARLDDYRTHTDEGLLPDKQVHDYIQLIRKYLSIEQALPLYRKVLAMDVDDPRISFDIGRSLLTYGDPQGITALQNAMTKDPSFTVMACQLIIQYYVQAGDSRNAQVYRRKALAYQVEAA